VMSVFGAGAMLAVVHTLPLTALLPAASSVWLITPGGAGAVTVIAAVPLCPSLVAVIVADPAPCPVTSPLPLTVATLVLLLAHVTVRPVSGLPFASFGVAVSGTVPCSGIDAAGGLTLTVATGTGGGVVTVIAAVPLCPSLAAVIVAVPATFPVTSPAALTVATVALLLTHVTARPTSGFPFASCGVAVSGTVAPATTLAVAGLTATDATGVGHMTLTLAVSDLSPGWLVAATWKVPHDAVFQ